MKKMNITKKALSLLLIGTLLASLFCGIPLVARANTPTADTESVYFDIINDKVTGTSTCTYTFNNINTVNSDSVDRWSCMPYNEGSKMIWTHDNITEFYIHAFGRKTWSLSDFEERYKFSASSDGETWTTVSFTQTRVCQYTRASDGYSFDRLDLQDIPAGTKYIQLTHGTLHSWEHGTVLGAGYSYALTQPTFKAVYKNKKGYYVNELVNGGTATSEVKLNIKALGTATAELKKNGTTVTLSDYWNTSENAYVFADDATYAITAGSVSFAFTVAKDSKGYNYTQHNFDIGNSKSAGTSDYTYTMYTMSNIQNLTTLMPEIGGSYVKWNVDNLAALDVITFAASENTDFSKAYMFKGSVDGTNWYDLSFDSTSVNGFDYFGKNAGQPTFKLSVKIPDGTRYVRLTSEITGDRWNRGIIYVIYETAEEVRDISFNAAYKNYFGYYANKFTTNSVVTKDVELKISGIDPMSDTVSVTKDGSPYTATMSESGAYYFTERGVYTVNASNTTGASETFTFTISESTYTGGYAVKTETDNIFENGFSRAHEIRSAAGSGYLTKMSISTFGENLSNYISSAHTSDRYILWPYNYFDGAENSPRGYTTWYDDKGIAKFVADTFTNTARTEQQLRDIFKFYYSADGVNWTAVDFTLGDRNTNYTELTSGVSDRMIIEALPDNTKYVRVQPNVLSGWDVGIIKAEWSYLKPVSRPEISAVFTNKADKYVNPLSNSGIATGAVKLKVSEMENGGTVTVNRDGNSVNTADYYNSTEDAYFFPENGTYTVTATNVAGTESFGFTVSLGVRDGYYIEESTVYNIATDNITGAYENTYNHNRVNSGTLSGAHSYFPDAASAHITWSSEDISSFKLETFDPYSADDAFFAKWYVLEASVDGTTWTRLSYTRTKSFDYANNHNGHTLTVDAVPDGTKYIRLSREGDEKAWDKGTVLGATVNHYKKISAPVVTAAYKNISGIYANTLKSGAKAPRSVKLTATEISGECGGTVTVKKDNTPLNAADYYNNAEQGYVFTEDGSYSVTFENRAGMTVFGFSIETRPNGQVEFKTVTDNIFENGTTLAYERLDAAGMDYLTKMSVVSFGSQKSPGLDYNSSVSLERQNDRYIMFPYNHFATEDAAASRSLAYASWSDSNGITSFSVETFNSASYSEAKLHEVYKFYTSQDGSNWTPVDFVYEGTVTNTDLINSEDVSHKLTVKAVPDGTKYIRLQPDVLSGWNYGVLRASYQTTIGAPIIRASFKDSDGNFINPIGNGAVSPTEVKLEVADVGIENGIPESFFTVKKDGSQITINNGDILTENGNYEVAAVNRLGTRTLSFKINKQSVAVTSPTYVFSAGLASATEDYEKLLSFKPAGAPNDFTKGDGQIIVNDTVAKKYKDTAAEWGCTEDGTNLTVGSDSKGYNKDGYFYFLNVDENGNKYTGISITYSMSSAATSTGYLAIYTADKYNGEYRLIKPTSTTLLSTNYRANVYTSVYYLRDAGSVVKVELHPNASIASLWEGQYLALHKITKLTLPTLTAKAGGKLVESGDITTNDVKLSVSNESYWFIEKDGAEYVKPANNTLTEDGYYTIYAVNGSGTASVSFYIAKQMPVAQFIDVDGNSISSGSVVTDDVRVISHNASQVEITRDGEFYSNSRDIRLTLNGVYKVFVSNRVGEFEGEIIIARPTPVIMAYNFRNRRISDGDIISTSVKFSINNTPAEEFKLTEEGDYVIEAVNAAGTVTLSFTLRYNESLPEYTHKGNTVKIVDYENGARFDDSRYKYESMERDAQKSIQSDWTGMKGPSLRPQVRGEGSDAYITYKSVGFESFVAYVVNLPELETDKIYELYASVNGVDYQKLDYSVEQDMSYVTLEYEKFRLIAKDIPDGAKYMKLVIRGEKAKYTWSRLVARVEFSYDKAKVGKFDVEDTMFMLNDAEDGGEVVIDIYNKDTVIPKKVFDTFKDQDKTLTVNLLDNSEKSVYRLSFNGLENLGSMDFNVRVDSPESAGLKYVKNYDKNATAVSFAQQGEWTMSMTFVKVMEAGQKGHRYALYKYTDGVLELVDSQLVPTSCYLAFTLTGNGDYIISSVVDILKTETDDGIGEDEVIDDGYTDEEEDSNIIDVDTDEELDETENKYMMVLNRKKFVPFGEGTVSVLLIVLISVAALLVIGAAVVVLIVLNKKNKLSFKFFRKG